MQASLPLQFYLFFKVIFVLIKNVLLCTGIMHYPYVTKFARRYKFQISEAIPTQVAEIPPHVKVRQWL
jgi:hypothetical protein